jgi:hypothetical protein
MTCFVILMYLEPNPGKPFTLNISFYIPTTGADLNTTPTLEGNSGGR